MPQETNDPGPCTCSQVRRTARRISAFYDAALSPSGLTVTQYALLANIGRAGKLSVTALAEKLGMDRTTLTRNLRPLEKKKLVATSPGDDRRERLLSLPAAGERKLQQSRPLWENAQRRFALQLGSRTVGEFRNLLTAAETAASQTVGSGAGS